MRTFRSIHALLLGTGLLLASCVAEPPPVEGAASSTTTQALTAGWTAIAPMPLTRGRHGAVLLGDGRLLAIGGVNRAGFVTTADVFDPPRGSWSSLGNTGISGNITHALLLPNGKALVLTEGSPSGRLFDPRTNTWTATANGMASNRLMPSVTGLADGRVLIAGGAGAGDVRLTTAEIYDPASNTFTATGSMAKGRNAHVAALLRDGRVLAVSGFDNVGAVPSAELFDPATGTWSSAAPPLVPRRYASATLLPDGRVLLAGGFTTDGVTTHAELYDPAANTWTATGALPEQRNGHTATLLPNGRVLVTGGANTVGNVMASSTEYDPAVGLWTAARTMQVGREHATATLLPTGRVLILGGFSASPSLTFFADAELYEPASDAWAAFAQPATQRGVSRAAMLPDGDVLLVGNVQGGNVASAERFDLATGAWASTPAPSQAGGTLSRLRSGDLLSVADGHIGVERYQVGTASWVAAADLPHTLRHHSATTLRNGQVLVLGDKGQGATPEPVSLRYDPATNVWTTVAAGLPLTKTSAVLLTSGKLLVVGGSDAAAQPSAIARLYDPATDTWSGASAMHEARTSPAVTLLPSGTVLVTGGLQGTIPVGTSEIYDPITNTWSTPVVYPQARSAAATTLLSNGTVLLAGGARPGGAPASVAAVFQPESGRWQETAGFDLRGNLALVTLPSGEALALGGQATTKARRYQGAISPTAWLPTLSAPSALVAACRSELQGTMLRGLGEGSGGGYATSPTNYPLVRLLGSEGSLWNVPTTAWTTNRAALEVPADVPAGVYSLHVLVNGLGGGRMVDVRPNAAPIVNPQTVTLVQGTSIAITVTASDPDLEQTLDWELVDAPAHGTLTGTLPSVAYAAPADWLGTDTFTVRASDSCNQQSALATITITVTDAPPSLTCPQPQALEATSAAGASGDWPEAVAEAGATVSYDPARGEMFPLGTTTVTSTATTADGASATCSFEVTVRDTTAPALTCPPDRRVTATSAAGAQVDYESASASDLVSTPTITSTPASGSSFPNGATSVTATATDAAGNAARCAFTVTVDALADGTGAGDGEAVDLGGGDGCGCRTHASARSPLATTLLAALALLAVRRRRR